MPREVHGGLMKETPESSPRPTFVFIGVVRQMRATNVPEAPSSAQTAIVAVERVIVSTPEFADISGEITVLLPENRPIDVDERRTFHCIGWILGSGLAVRAVEVTSPEERVLDAVGGAGANPSEALRVQQLSGRIATSELIVSGVVSEVRSPPGAKRARRLSEHDPDWHEAIVQVQSITKGEAPVQGIVVAFPLSRDVSWRQAPKFHVGQRGVWLLRTVPAGGREDELAAFVGQPYPVFTALDPLDFQPVSEEERVSAIAEHPQGQ
jgi:hypothetical protein